MIPPPYARLLGITLDRDAQGATVLTMPFADEVVGRPGFLHGGAIGGLLELAAAAALDGALAGGDGTRGALVTMTVDYRRGGRDRPTHAAAVIVRLGTRVANIEAVAWQDDRAAPIATARVTVAVARD